MWNFTDLLIQEPASMSSPSSPEALRSSSATLFRVGLESALGGQATASAEDHGEPMREKDSPPMDDVAPLHVPATDGGDPVARLDDEARRLLVDLLREAAQLEHCL